MLPNYYAYHRTEEWRSDRVPDPKDLREILDIIWENISKNHLTRKTIDLLLQESGRFLEEGDSTDSRYYCEGLHTIDAICYTLEAFVKPLPYKILQVVNKVELTIADFLIYEEETLDPSWGERDWQNILSELANHPLTIREKNKQIEDLQQLKTTKILDAEFLKRFRISSNNNSGKSLLDLC